MRDILSPHPNKQRPELVHLGTESPHQVLYQSSPAVTHVNGGLYTHTKTKSELHKMDSKKLPNDWIDLELY